MSNREWVMVNPNKRWQSCSCPQAMQGVTCHHKVVFLLTRCQKLLEADRAILHFMGSKVGLIGGCNEEDITLLTVILDSQLPPTPDALLKQGQRGKLAQAKVPDITTANATEVVQHQPMSPQALANAVAELDEQCARLRHSIQVARPHWQTMHLQMMKRALRRFEADFQALRNVASNPTQHNFAKTGDGRLIRIPYCSETKKPAGMQHKRMKSAEQNSHAAGSPKPAAPAPIMQTPELANCQHSQQGPAEVQISKAGDNRTVGKGHQTLRADFLSNRSQPAASAIARTGSARRPQTMHSSTRLALQPDRSERM
eukprot:jgi/Ulvmu1/2160/UM013_0003.1